jgi:hypothetical protein
MVRMRVTAFMGLRIVQETICGLGGTDSTRVKYLALTMRACASCLFRRHRDRCHRCHGEDHWQ